MTSLSSPRSRSPTPTSPHRSRLSPLLFFQRTSWQRRGSLDYPVGSGQYKLSAANLQTGDFTLDANPNWYGEQPRAKTLVISTVPDGATRLAQVADRAGRLFEKHSSEPAQDAPGNLRVEKVGFPGGNDLPGAQ